MVVESEIALLQKSGHSVHLVSVSNDSISGAWRKVRLAWRTAYNPDSIALASAEISKFRPEVVHIHNFFPLLTSAVHVAAAQNGVGVVQTMHNYRMLCAAATFERDGHVCEDCLISGTHNAIRHRCYRNSYAATAAIVRMQAVEKRSRRIVDSTDRVICLTKFAREKFIQGGWPDEKIVVKPNFLDRQAVKSTGPERKGALFVGRLAHEKGVQLLLNAWKCLSLDCELRVVGDGPLGGVLREQAGPNVKFLGKLDAEGVRREMLTAELLVVPSLWYEGFPMIIVEAFSCGLPVVASGHGSLREIIVSGRNGMHFVPGSAESLSSILLGLLAAKDQLAQMGAAAASDFEELYSASRNRAMLEKIYEDAIASARGS